MLRSTLRPLAAVAALAGLAAYATIMLRGPQGITALEEKRQQIRALEDDIATRTRNIELKKQRIERLKHDPGTLEVEIEKNLDKIPEGSTEFKIPGQRIGDPKADTATQADDSKPPE